jgi:hypothetical protein
MTQEQLRMQMLAGIITEGQYKAKLNENNNYIDIEYPSGDYPGDVRGDKVSFLLIDSSIEDEYEEGFGALDDQSILDYLGTDHFFTHLYDKIGGEIEGYGDEVSITVDLNDLKSNFGEYITQ